MNKVNILSMGWRSHWLANRLKSLGIKVLLIEVTNHLDWSDPEDIDGPFPFSITLHSPEDFVNFIRADDIIHPLKTGFCLSTPLGNLSWDALNRGAVLQVFKDEFKKKVLEDKNFWFDDFLKSFSKSSFKKALLWSEEKEVFNLESELYLRRSDKKTYLKSLEFLKKQGVQVQLASNQDLRKILLEVKENSKDWIISLTVSELKILTSNEKNNIRNGLGWHRKRFFYESKNLGALPVWSIWLNSPFKPWKEENFIIIIKGGQDNYLDIWTLEEVYNKKMKTESIEKIQDFLKNKFRFVEFAPKQSENLGGLLKTLFPVSYGKEVLNDTNYIWNSPIDWRGYSMNLMYRYQYSLVQAMYNKGVK